ncbi:MAG: hypothetical protein ACJ8LD_10435 [Pantoea agglomerans]
MSKVKTAVLDILSDGKWHKTAELVDIACKTCRTNRMNVESVINTLCGGHYIIKEHIDNQHGVCRYRMKDASAGFGISPQMASLNELLKAARGRHENLVHP